MIENYRRAIRYAGCLNYDRRKDIVHNAYLRWHKAYGLNLFDEHEGTVCVAVRNAFLSDDHERHYVYQGVKKSKSYYEFTDQTYNRLTPDGDIIANDLITNIEKSLTPKEQEIFELLSKGYSQTDIAEILGKSQQLVHIRKTSIKNKTNKILMREEYLNHNPFNSNPLVVSKVVKRETYDKNPDKYSDYIYDTDRGADYNEWYTLLVSSENKGLLIRENYEESRHVNFPG